jgi:PAS domain S-box-containing protein
LQQREQDFMTLANAIPQLAWMADATGYIFWYNERWYNYTGTTLEEMQGKGWQKVQDPAYVAGVTDRFTAAIEAGTPWQDLFPLRGHDGQYRWFLSRALPVRDENGQVVRWCGTNTDVTEERQLQEQLINSHNDLEAKITFRNLELEHEVKRLREQLKES